MLALTMCLVLRAGAEVTTLSNDAGADLSTPPADTWPMPSAPHAFAIRLDAKSTAPFIERLRVLPARERVKALHDAIALTLTYDKNELAAQTVEAVTSRTTATCDGYAATFKSLGQRAGLEVEVVQGLLKVAGLPPQPHAWNAVRIAGAWQLVDVTLDDPMLRGAGAKDSTLRSDYLLVPPAIAAIDHWPFQPRWSLGAQRLTREAFIAQPRVSSPSLERLAVQVSVAPHRTSMGLELTLSNPRHAWLLLALDGVACGPPTDQSPAVLRCEPADASVGRLELLAHAFETGLFLSVFEFDLAISR